MAEQEHTRGEISDHKQHEGNRCSEPRLDHDAAFGPNRNVYRAGGKEIKKKGADAHEHATGSINYSHVGWQI